MESPPFKTGHDEDRISALPDELLIGILERLDLPDADRAGGVSTRWRHLPHQLSRLDLNVHYCEGTGLLEGMDAFMSITRRLLSLDCDCKSRRAVKTLRLCFFMLATHLSSIGCVVEDTVGRGETDRFELELMPPFSDLSPPQKADWRELGQQFMSFSRSYPITFQWLTDLSLTSLEFGDSDLPSLMGACHKLKHLSLRYCRLGWHSVLKIDVPNSVIQKLVFTNFRCMRIELVSVPKLTQLVCRYWQSRNPPLRLGYVPDLRYLYLSSHAKAGHLPFALSDCFSMGATNLSQLHLNFSCQMIWIQPEHPKQRTAIFSKLTYVGLWCIFPECDLNWTLFILEAAPALQEFTLSRRRHSCVKTSEHSAEKTNVVWEPSKDLKHLNLKLLAMIGFEEEDKVGNYIRLVMELAGGLKRIRLQSQTCWRCKASDPEYPRKSQADEASRHRIKERLTQGSSSSVEIIIC